MSQIRFFFFFYLVALDYFLLLLLQRIAITIKKKTYLRHGDTSNLIHFVSLLGTGIFGGTIQVRRERHRRR